MLASPLVLMPASYPPPSTRRPLSSSPPNARSLNRAFPRSARLRRLKRPSPCVGEGDVLLDRTDLPRDGVRSFQAATMFLTEVSGDRGDVCGLRNEDAVGVAVVVKPELVKVFVLVYELVAVGPVPVKVLGPLRVCVNVPLLVGGNRESADRDVGPRGGGERREDIGPEDDTVDPDLLLVGDDGREL